MKTEATNKDRILKLKAKIKEIEKDIEALERKKPLAEDLLPGGQGDYPDFILIDHSEVIKGLLVEFEHTVDPRIALEICLDHLSEDPRYYSKLEKAGLADELNTFPTTTFTEDTTGDTDPKRDILFGNTITETEDNSAEAQLHQEIAKAFISTFILGQPSGLTIDKQHSNVFEDDVEEAINDDDKWDAQKIYDYHYEITYKGQRHDVVIDLQEDYEKDPFDKGVDGVSRKWTKFSIDEDYLPLPTELKTLLDKKFNAKRF